MINKFFINQKWCYNLSTKEKQMTFEELYKLAFSVSNETLKTKDCEIGSVGCALESETGNVYLGKNIDMSCSLGMCAERNAISNMLTKEVKKISKIVVVHKSGKVMLPCGACREFMLQLGDLTEETELLLSLEPYKTVKIVDLLPNWWRRELSK